MSDVTKIRASDLADAELIRICAEHIANHREFNARAGEVPIDEDPRWTAYERTLYAICDSEPKTLAGIIAKARAAQVEAIDPGGYEVPEDEVPLIWSIVKDLIRLGEEHPQPSALGLGAPTTAAVGKDDSVVTLWAELQTVNAELHRVSDQQSALRDAIIARRGPLPRGVAWKEWYRGDPYLAKCDALLHRSNHLCTKSADLYHEIAAAAAASSAGVRAKAAAALSVWIQEKALEEEMWCYDLIANALREAAVGSAE